MKPFRVYQDRCDQCLYSKDKIVSDARRKDLIEQTRDSWFVCHKASIRGESVCCKGNYDTWSKADREMAETLNLIEFVPLPDAPTNGAKDKLAMAPIVPDGYQLVPDGDFNEKVQPGDFVWDTDDDEWVKADRRCIGQFCCNLYTARPLPKPIKKPVRRVMRTRPQA